MGYYRAFRHHWKHRRQTTTVSSEKREWPFNQQTKREIIFPS
jgi:hypothetical protein